MSGLTSTTVREALIRARSALLTCLGDGPEDLEKPERRSVIDRCIREITEVLPEPSSTAEDADVNEIQVTEEMVEAGLSAFYDMADSELWDYGSLKPDIVVQVYRAMECAGLRPLPARACER